MRLKKLNGNFLLLLIAGFIFLSPAPAFSKEAKNRILVVSSYHPEYAWSQETNKGFSAAMLKNGYFDNIDQIDAYTKNDYVETSRAIISKMWMDSKRKSSTQEMEEISKKIYKTTSDFKPDLILLGDDNAAKYIGTLFVDSQTPVVFWGVNNTPVKYGLVDNIEKPGHNVTGVYQSGYYSESMELLKELVPGAETFAILSDNTSTGRSHVKKIQYLAKNGNLPMKLVETVLTGNYEEWKNKALELQNRVDAFFIAQYSALTDKTNSYVPTKEVNRWYTENISIPETTFGGFVKEGMLCAADDPGYNQGYEAAEIAHDILANGADPATYPARTPTRGSLVVNKQRAKQLGIKLTDDMGIEEYVEGAVAKGGKKRILVISSYHREYLWSQDTNSGVVDALLKYKYLDNEKQAEKYTNTDYVDSSTAVVRKLWMDTKRKSTKNEIQKTVYLLIKKIEEFNPDIILLGDDNATNYIGKQYIDTEIPLVFWGVNGLPLKYGLLDSLEKPGHNVTGVYQAGYLKETVNYLKKLVPDIKSMAVLSDDSPTGRSKAKELMRLATQGKLPVTLVETVITNSFDEWKSKALELSEKADAFFILNHNTIKDATGKPVDQMEVGAWYLENIKKPDAAHEKQFVIEGILCAVDDSGFKQGYEAVKLAYQILEEGKKPAEMSSYAPDKGPFIVNRQRAAMLGLDDNLKDNPMIDEYVERAMALDQKNHK